MNHYCQHNPLSKTKNNIRGFYPFSLVTNPFETKSHSLLFQGVDMSQNLKGGVIMTNGSLVLQGLNRNASGKYNCVATNSEGPAFSNTVQLDIKCKPCKAVDHCYYQKLMPQTT